MKHDWPGIVTAVAKGYQQSRRGGWVYLAHAMGKDGIVVTPSVLQHMAQGKNTCRNPDAVVWLWEKWKEMQEPRVVQSIVARNVP